MDNILAVDVVDSIADDANTQGGGTSTSLPIGEIPQDNILYPTDDELDAIGEVKSPTEFQSHTLKDIMSGYIVEYHKLMSPSVYERKVVDKCEEVISKYITAMTIGYPDLGIKIEYNIDTLLALSDGAGKYLLRDYYDLTPEPIIEVEKELILSLFDNLYILAGLQRLYMHGVNKVKDCLRLDAYTDARFFRHYNKIYKTTSSELYKLDCDISNDKYYTQYVKELLKHNVWLSASPMLSGIEWGIPPTNILELLYGAFAEYIKTAVIGIVSSMRPDIDIITQEGEHLP